MKKLLIVMMLLTVAALSQSDSATFKAMEKLQDQWCRKQRANGILTVEMTTEKGLTDAQRAVREEMGRQRAAAIDEEFRGRASAYVTRAVAQHARMKATRSHVVRGFPAHDAVFDRLKSGKYSWGDLSTAAKYLREQAREQEQSK